MIIKITTKKIDHEKEKAKLWIIKDNGGIYNIDWRLNGPAAAYNPVSIPYNLCLLEKLYIAENTGENLLTRGVS